MAAEFYKVCERVASAAEESVKSLLKVVQGILGSSEAAEVLLLSLEGLPGNLTSAKLLRRRVEL